MAVIDRVTDLVTPLITSLDLTLYDIEHAGPVLRISVDKPTPTPIRVADLDGVSVQADSDEWQATVTITVFDAGQNPVDDAKVFAIWSNGKSVNCTTAANGQCSLTSDKFKNAEVSSISFTVTDVTHDEVLIFNYQPANNADPEGDSDGTTSTVGKP